MVQMDDAPGAIALVAESGPACNCYMLSHHHFEIILHPRGIADHMMCARDGGKLCRRILLEISFTVIVQVCKTSVEITGRREGYNVRIKTFAESMLVGTIESIFAKGELLV